MIDFDAFADDVLNMDAFAQEVTWTPSGGQGKTINAVFDNSFVAVEGVGDAGVSSSMPSVLCKASDVTGAGRGDTVVRNSVTYYVTEAQPGDDGFTTLILSKDA